MMIFMNLNHNQRLQKPSMGINTCINNYVNNKYAWFQANAEITIPTFFLFPDYVCVHTQKKTFQRDLSQHNHKI